MRQIETTGRLRGPIIVRWAAILVGALGLVAVIGWIFDITLFKSILAGLSTLKFNTAIGFVLSAGALALHETQTRDWRRQARLALPIIVGMLGALTLIEYVTGVDLHIDQLLFRDAGASSMPGRMSVVTAVEFVLFSVALLLAFGRSRLTHAGFLMASALGMLIAFLALTGYLYRLPLLYAPIPQSSIAVHTAAGFFMLFLGAAALRPELGWMSLLQAQTITGLFARWLLPIIIIGPLLLGWGLLQGAEAGLYAPRDGLALFALGSVTGLALVVWLGGGHANRLGARLERRERVFQTVAETALDAFILMDQRGCIIEWNPAAEHIFGWTREETIGQMVAEKIIPEAHRAAHAASLAGFVATGQSKVLRQRLELTAVRRDGKHFPVELMILPVRHGGEWLFSGFVKDLTALKQAEAQARQAQKMEAVGQLTGGVAHDFNNLLTVVIATLDVLMKRVTPELRQPMENALNAAERGAELIQRLLAFSRKQTLDPKRLDLNAIASGMIDILKRTLGEQIEIELRLDSATWPSLADKAQVENALLNLALNARDAMPKGGKLIVETGNIELDAAYAARNADVRPGAYVMIAVSDTGAGMSPQIAERAFEPFFTTKEVGKGSGLGLSMIYGFAKQSNGHVKIYSEIGHGTTVRLYLPKARADAAEADVAPEAEENTPTARSGETILVLEDDVQVRALVADQLRVLGYSVLEAGNAAEARVILASEARIDLLFTDVVLPGHSTGRHIADEARVLRPKLKTLFTSGYTDNSIVHHGRLDAGVQFLAKPYRVYVLAQKVRHALDV